MQPITATQRTKIQLLLSISTSTRLPDANRKAAEDALLVWVGKAHAAGAPSLGAWMDGPTAAPANPRHMSMDAYKRACGAA